MKSLPVAKLGSLTSLISSGSTPLGGASRYLSEGPVMFIRSQNVRMNCLDLSDVVYIDSSLHEEMKRTHVRSGDVFMNITGASIGRVAAFDRNGEKANVNQHVCIIRPKSEMLDFRYLTIFLCSPRFQEIINRLQRGGTRQALTFDMIANFDIPLPSLPEQRRIADILEKADAIRRKREEGIRLTEELLRSSFQQMFGDPATNAMGWEVSTLGTITKLVTSGLTPTGGSTVYVEEGPIFIRSQNVLMNRLDLSDVACLPRAIHESMSRTKVHEGDVLLNITGASIGRVAWVNALREEANVNQHVCIIRPDQMKATPEFISAYISLPFSQRQIDNMQSGASRQGLNHQQVRSLKIPLPPLSLQQRYSKAVTMMRKVSDQREHCRLASEELFNALVQRAFRGELTNK